jgi:hypothetical protein
MRQGICNMSIVIEQELSCQECDGLPSNIRVGSSQMRELVPAQWSIHVGWMVSRQALRSIKPAQRCLLIAILPSVCRIYRCK